MTSSALAGADLIAFWAALKSNKSMNERDRVTICAIARSGRIAGPAAISKMCGGFRGINTRTVEQTLAKHSALVERWSVKVAA